MGAYIGIFDGDYIRHIRYCNDSNIEEILLNHYNTLESIMSIVRFGNVLSLGDSVDSTTFYVSDGELRYDFRHYSQFANTIRADISTQIGFVYSPLGKKWYAITPDNPVYCKVKIVKG